MKDWKIISQVGKLVNIVLEDIQPYRLYFAVDHNLEDIAPQENIKIR